MHITQQSWRDLLGDSKWVSSRAQNTQGALWGNLYYLFDHQTAVSTCLSAQLLLNPELSRTGGQQINAEEPKSRHPCFFSRGELAAKGLMVSAGRPAAVECLLPWPRGCLRGISWKQGQDSLREAKGTNGRGFFCHCGKNNCISICIVWGL